MKVISVKALPKYRILVLFEDGVTGEIDLNELVGIGIFAELKDENLFSKVYSPGYSIAWSEELEIDAFAIYAELLSKRPENVLKSTYFYASN